MDKDIALVGGLAVLMAAAPQAAAGGVVDRFAARAENSLVSFDYTMRLKGSIPLTGNGSVVFKGDAYRVVGNGLELVCDGSTRCTADNAAKELYIESADQGAGMLVSSPALLLRDLGRAFVRGEEHRASFEGSAALAVSLTPIAEDSGIVSMTVYFKGEEPVGAEVSSEDGSVTVIRLSKLSISDAEGPDMTYNASALGDDWVITDLR